MTHESQIARKIQMLSVSWTLLMPRGGWGPWKYALMNPEDTQGKGVTEKIKKRKAKKVKMIK